MEKLSVSIYRNAEFNCDCTNNGVSSRHDRMILFFGCKKEEAVNYCEKNGIGKETALWLNPRILWGCDHFFAEPLEKRNCRRICRTEQSTGGLSFLEDCAWRK